MPFELGATPMNAPELQKAVEDAGTFLEARVDQEHDGYGRHSHVTLASIAHADGPYSAADLKDLDATIDQDRVLVGTGLHFLSGPWMIGLSDSEPGPSVIRPSSLTANQNDWQPDGIEDCLVVEIESTAERTITGIFAEIPLRRRFLWLVNRGNYTIVLASASSSSLSRHRLYFGGGNYPLLSGSMVQLYYDPGSGGWRGPAMTGFRSVQRGTITISSTNTSATVTLATTLTDVGKSMVSFLGVTGPGGGVSVEELAYLSDLTTTSLKATRSTGASGNPTVTSYQVVEYY